MRNISSGWHTFLAIGCAWMAAGQLAHGSDLWPIGAFASSLNAAIAVWDWGES